jgi:hypothetical protein
MTNFSYFLSQSLIGSYGSSIPLKVFDIISLDQANSSIVIKNKCLSQDTNTYKLTCKNINKVAELLKENEFPKTSLVSLENNLALSMSLLYKKELLTINIEKM